MKLRERFVVTLVVIAIILAAPAAYAVTLIHDLRQDIVDITARNATRALQLVKVQAAFRDMVNSQTVFLALANFPDAPEYASAKRQIAQNAARVEEGFADLSQQSYGGEVQTARQAWDSLKTVLTQEQVLIESGNVEVADTLRRSVRDASVQRLEQALNDLGTAIDEVGERQIAVATATADRASSITLLALGIALAAALLLGGWLTQSLVSPLQRLRRGMAVVAAGDFSPKLAEIPERPDEIGDLGHSFHRMTEQLAELDRLKAEFVSVASHELKTPLSVIKGYLSLLLDGIYGNVSEEQRKILASVGDQTDRLARLIQQLLDVSRFEAGGGRLEIKEVELKPFLQELASAFEPLAVQNEIEFGVHIEPDLPAAIQCDADRLNEVLGNLLSNAFKFTPRNGRIRMLAGTADGGIGIAVSDTGVGVPPDKLPRIFEKFFQVDNDAQPRSVGSGLGLAISREIVEAHGGTISAESRVGKGTTIRVFLPREPPVHEASES